MNKRIQSKITGLRSVICFTLMGCVSLLSGATIAQDPDAGDAEAAAIKAIEDAGGRVSKISAQDETREISFNLSEKPITDQQLADTAKVSNVIWLNLAGTKITNDALKHIAKMTGLQKLHLEKTQISDEGLAHLKELTNLEYLNIYDTQVTDAGLDHLAGLEKLRKLYVWKSQVTDAGINQLNAKLPELQITGEIKFAPPVEEKQETKEDKKPETEEAKSPESKVDTPEKGDTASDGGKKN